MDNNLEKKLFEFLSESDIDFYKVQNLWEFTSFFTIGKYLSHVKNLKDFLPTFLIKLQKETFSKKYWDLDELYFSIEFYNIFKNDEKIVADMTILNTKQIKFLINNKNLTNDDKLSFIKVFLYKGDYKTVDFENLVKEIEENA